METNKKWFQKPNAIVLFLVFFFPVGLFLMWKYAPWRKKSKWIITGLILLFVVFASIPSNSQTQSESKKVEQEVTEKPTNSPKPSETTKEINLTEAELAYHESVTEIMLSQSDYLMEIGELQNDPLEIYTNEERMFTLAAAIAGVKMNYEKAEALTPPSKYVTFHKEFLASMKLFNDAMDDLTIGIDEMNADKLYEATDKMAEGRETLNNAMELYPQN